MTALLKKLIKASGVSGRESKIAGVIREVAEGYADDIHSDALGNLIVYKKGSSASPKKLMLAAHMDEIGFTVTFIDEKGYLRVAPVGGIEWTAAAFTSVVFADGTRGVLVPEAQTKPSEFAADKFVIDIGAENRRDAEKRVSVGDFASVEPILERLANRRYAGRPLDDRIGCVVLLEALRTVKDCKNDTYFVFTAQEEVGCRGARTAAFGIAPDFSVAFDVTDTGDECNSRPMAVKLGAGCAIKIKDSSVICDPALTALLRSEAEKAEIKYQLEILTAGGTDTSAMQTAAAGSRAAAISIPTRYIHTGVELIDMRDVEAVEALTLRLLELDIGAAGL